MNTSSKKCMNIHATWDHESPRVNSEESRFAVKRVLWILDFGIVIEGL